MVTATRRRDAPGSIKEVGQRAVRGGIVVISDLGIEVPVIDDVRVQKTISSFRPTCIPSTHSVCVHHDQLILGGVFPENTNLCAVAVCGIDIVEYRVVRRAVKFLSSVLDPDIAESVRIDSAPMSIRGFEDQNIKAQVVQRVSRVEAGRPCPDDHDVVVSRGFDCTGRPRDQGQRNQSSDRESRPNDLFGG